MCGKGCNKNCNKKCGCCKDELIYCGKGSECLSVEKGDKYKDVVDKTMELACDTNSRLEQYVEIYDPNGIEGDVFDYNNFYNVPENVSEFNNDAGYITQTDIPENVSEFNNDAGYITQTDIPENVSEFNNDAGYITQDEVSLEYQKTLFVDNVYGNNSTGVREDFFKPYNTIQSAINSATSGDTVHVRSGNYSENIVLKDGVNLFFESVVLNGTITDGGVKTKSVIKGGLKLTSQTKYVITISAAGSEIIMDIEGTDCRDTLIRMDGGTEQEPNYLTFLAKYIRGLSIDYILRASENCNVTIHVFEEVVCNTSLPGWSYALLFTRGNFTGRVYFTAPYVYIGESSVEEENNRFLWLNSEEGGRVVVDVGTIESDSQSVNAIAYIATVRHEGHEDVLMRVDEMRLKGTTGINFRAKGGSMCFQGNIVVGKDKHTIEYRSERLLSIRNSRLIKTDGNGGLSNACVLIESYDTSITESKFKIDNSVIVTDKTSVSGGGVINIDSLGSLGSTDVYVYLSDVEIISGDGSSESLYAGSPKGVYMRNVVSNVDKDVSVTDLALNTGFTHDVNLPLIY